MRIALEQEEQRAWELTPSNRATDFGLMRGQILYDSLTTYFLGKVKMEGLALTLKV